MDVATGTGLAALSATRAVGEGGKVVGVDLSPGMLAVARGAIEAMFSKLKEFLRSAKARTFEALLAAMDEALKRVGLSDIAGWFTHCGHQA